jgi:peptidoglycan/xylan/chitin deacetylase (PgdA/CDA1 family)
MRPLSNRARGAAFLCYHSIADGGPPFLSLGPDLFERHLALLRRKGWSTGTGADLTRLASGERPDRPVAFLTFDDGYVDNHDAALPLLREYASRAIVFVLPPRCDDGGPLAWAEVEGRRAKHPEVFRSMTWTMAEALVEAGSEIGSHTMSHAHLPDLEPEALEQELLDSRRAVQARLGGPCDLLAYPFGEWSPRVADAAARAGYRFAFTMPRGSERGGGAHCIPRTAIDHRDDERRLAIKLSAPGRMALLSPLRQARRGIRGRLP